MRVGLLVGLLVVVLAGSGCGAPGEEEIRRHAEDGAAQARPLARALAAEFDPVPETIDDKILKCRGRGHDDPAMELDLRLRVDFDDADQDRLVEVLVPAYEKDGWRHHTNPWDDHHFVKDEIVLTVSRQDDHADITGSAGCWPD